MSKLTLCLHASARLPRIYLLRNGAVVANDPGVAAGDPRTDPSFAELTERLLQDIGASISDIDEIAVDIGPGRLSAVRAAVSFANALAFGLDRPLRPLVSTHGAGFAAEQITGLPAIVAHKAAAGAGYVGLVRAGVLERLRHGPMVETVEAFSAPFDVYALVGAEAATFDLAGKDVRNGGDATIAAETFLALLPSLPAVQAPVHPITEQSEFVDD